MVLLMQCFLENVLKPSLLQDVVMSTQEVQNDEGMVNEGKKKSGHWAETLKNLPVLNLYLAHTCIQLCISMIFRYYYNYYLSIHFVI